jgi:hypothetical protein
MLSTLHGNTTDVSVPFNGCQLLIHNLALSNDAETLVEGTCGPGCLCEVSRLHLLEEGVLDPREEVVVEPLSEGLLLLRVLLGCQPFHALDRL